ncbi:unnamed protein product [Acanthoscelides obtectus]|uniref:Uncharacterized protein n=1 Tax=Acanthoscelides obtectus TaxID=200917 RepID=A0A9P0M2L5_ACAOB|nr:unnamed protein product [Acanthoscelides obtectus]CAK1635465.1 hypothetical protein AOBTE_LOCUS9287 [Acanthoscelides obtectus]
MFINTVLLAAIAVPILLMTISSEAERQNMEVVAIEGPRGPDKPAYYTKVEQKPIVEEVKSAADTPSYWSYALDRLKGISLMQLMILMGPFLAIQLKKFIAKKMCCVTKRE